MNNTAFDYWGLLAGIALFLFAMAQLESGLQAVSGRSLAGFLRRNSNNRFSAVLGGTLATAILQSSSLVALMVLAFTGAGLLALPNALGIIMGTNLGTTFTGWIVTTIGFELKISELALPLIGIGGLAHAFGPRRWTEYGRAVLGLGLLLLGLQFMKDSVATLEQLINIDDLADLALWQFLLFGVVVAGVIQSSSATMMITLAALHAEIISLPSAAAIAIGADLGTTTTVMLGALKGSATKRQVAAGHVLFNLVTDTIAIMLLMPLLTLVSMLGVSDPLYALVAFHSLFNVVGLLMFLPFVGGFANMLERLFPADVTDEARYLREVSNGVPGTALEAVRRETSLLIERAIELAHSGFDPRLERPDGISPVNTRRDGEEKHPYSFDDLYNRTKLLEGEIVEFVIRLQSAALSPDEAAELGRLLSSARESIHSAKALKDVRHNLRDFTSMKSTGLEQFDTRFRVITRAFLTDIFTLRAENENSIPFESLLSLMRRTEEQHTDLHKEIFADVRAGTISSKHVSSLLNVNREIYVCQRSMILALCYFYLNEAQAEAVTTVGD